MEILANYILLFSLMYNTDRFLVDIGYPTKGKAFLDNLLRWSIIGFGSSLVSSMLFSIYAGIKFWLVGE